jgi:hypothetical protein
MRRIILFMSLLGTILFAVALVLSFTNPLLIERAAREIVWIEVEHRVGQRMDSLSDSRIVGMAQRALQRADVDIEKTKQTIREDVPKKVANVISNMLNADCECRKRLIQYSQKAATERMSSLMELREKLEVFVEAAYSSVTQNLLREFRIFSASNAAAFFLLGVVTLIRPRAGLQLVLPAIVLVGAVSATSGLYLFNQNWLNTIVFGQYVGLAYAAYLGLVALLLSDLVFNRARITTRFVNIVLSIVGSAIKAVPC